jgi:membrane-associated protease RseP (regulator of RpoE activity)
MTVLLFVLGVVLFAVGVAVSIGLHEMGHLIPGKLFNVKVTQFFVGFGRTLWSTRRGETEYGVKAIPLGGYCKLIGMVPPDPHDEDQRPDRVRSRNTGMFAQLVDDARQAEYEHIEPEDHDRLFYTKAAWKRIVIMGSGVAINLVLAFVLFAISFMGYGVYQSTTKVAGVSTCVIAVTQANKDQKQRACTPTDPVAPAKKAGLKPGDRILSFNGKPMRSWDDVTHAIRGNEAGAATIVVDRGGRQLTLETNTTVSPRLDPTNPERISRVGFLGVVPDQVRQRQSVGFVVTTMADGTWQTLQTIGALPNKLYHVSRAAVGLEQRDPNGPMSVVGAGRVAGELVSQPGTPLLDGLFSVLTLVAGLNLFLGLINLVPLPPFDGGGIATTLYEAIRRRWARLRGKPDPGGFDSARLLPLTYAMAMVILLVSVILIFADIVAPVSLS